MNSIMWNPEDILQETRDTVADPKQEEYFSARQSDRMSSITRGKAELDLPGTIKLLSSMGVYGTWLAMKGAIAVCRGRQEGWRLIHASFVYRAWGVRVAVAQADRRKKGSLLLRDGITDCLVHAIATGEDCFADWCGRRLVDSFNTSDGRFTHAVHGTPLEPFVIKLFALWRHLDVALSEHEGCDLGPYRQILEEWESDDHWNEAVFAACDYHCFTTGYLKYANVPYFVFPAEILALQRVRKELGFPVQEIEHPLMKTRFVECPGVPPKIEDPLLLAAEKKLRLAFPEIGVPW